MLYEWNNKAWMTAHLLITQFTEYFKSTAETYCLEKKIPLKMLLFTDNTPGHPRALMEMYNEINVVFTPANTTSFLQLINQGVISTFKSYYLRNTFHKAIAARDSNSYYGSRQRQLKMFWRGFTILHAMKNIQIHGKRSKYQHQQEFEGSCQPSWMTLGVQDFIEESNCRCGGNCRRTVSRSGA